MKKIVIVGGGSAGWMSASTLIKSFPDKEIVLIESSSIPTVGVGESTVSDINYWLHYLEIKDEDFMKETNATYKTAIGFTDFNLKKSPTFFTPFGDPDMADAVFGFNDFNLMRVIDTSIPGSDFCKYYYPQVHAIEKNKLIFEQNPVVNTYIPVRDTAYQVDAALFGKWLAENYAIPRGVKRIVSTIKHVEVDENGVKELVLDDGSKVTADLYIDCSGFKSLLLGNALQEPFVSTKEYLPNNKAWAGPVQYTDKEKELEVYTNCTGLKNGWAWNTPLWSRIGTGYVYSDEFVDDDTALQEFKEYLDSDKMKIHDPQRSEKMEFRKIEIKNGYYERFYVKNVCAVGLSAGFLEPLESTGLLFTHQILLFLINSINRTSVTKADKDYFNNVSRNLFEHQLQFVALHFLLSERDDTPYWKKYMDSNVPEYFLYELPFQKLITKDITKSGLYNSLFAANNFSPASEQIMSGLNLRYGFDFEKIIQNAYNEKQEKIKEIKNYIETLPSHYQYLKKTIYNES